MGAGQATAAQEAKVELEETLKDMQGWKRNAVMELNKQKDQFKRERDAKVREVILSIGTQYAKHKMGSWKTSFGTDESRLNKEVGKFQNMLANARLGDYKGISRDDFKTHYHENQ